MSLGLEKTKSRSFSFPLQVRSLICLFAALILSGSHFADVSAAARPATSTTSYGLEWPGDGAVRRMLYWHNPFPIYDATYIFKVYPRKKTTGTNPRYYTTFFWGNDGSFTWDTGNTANSYYGAHPYPVPAPMGPGQWEISVGSNDWVTGTEVQWDRWYTQVFRAWRESPTTTWHEFYWDWPDQTKVIRVPVNDPNWASKNPPTPAIVMGQAPNVNGASWGGYAGWEEFDGIIRGIQIYSGLLSLTDIQSEITAPKSSAAGTSFIWYLNLDPRPTDVTDKKVIGTPHNPSWDGTTALEWSQVQAAPSGDTTPPSVPTDLKAKPVSPNQIDLSWHKSKDKEEKDKGKDKDKDKDNDKNKNNKDDKKDDRDDKNKNDKDDKNNDKDDDDDKGKDAAGYLVFRNGIRIADVKGTSYSDKGLAPGTTYSYRVAAYDAAGNVSAQSSPDSATTFIEGIPPKHIH